MSCIHSFGGIIALSANNIATVLPYISVNKGSWYHSFGGTYFKYYAIHMATVIPLISYISGLCYHCSGGN